MNSPRHTAWPKQQDTTRQQHKEHTQAKLCMCNAPLALACQHQPTPVCMLQTEGNSTTIPCIVFLRPILSTSLTCFIALRDTYLDPFVLPILWPVGTVPLRFPLHHALLTSCSQGVMVLLRFVTVARRLLGSGALVLPCRPGPAATSSAGAPPSGPSCSPSACTGETVPGAPGCKSVPEAFPGTTLVLPALGRADRPAGSGYVGT